MIVRILSRGSSFKGLATYLTHDPAAETKDRVAWTHTLNLANDHVPSAVDEMLWTARHAELLKQEAGIRAGGRETESAVKHLSLNWAPDEKPDQAHMIASTEAFLRHMGWQEHQALLVSHTDRPYAHCHIELNVIHPETGLRLDDGFERRRAQAWALDYEREHGRIYCEQRLLDPGAREEAPTRPAWMAFRGQQQEFERHENSRRAQEPIIVDHPENAERPGSEEWKILKEAQRQERQAFFAEGKAAFAEVRRSVYREIREEFRDRWADFYAVSDGDGDLKTLAGIKAELVAEQKTLLEARRDEACQDLRVTRDAHYRELLTGQRDLRGELRERQAAGLDNSELLGAAGTRADNATRHAFRQSAQEMTELPRHEGQTQPEAVHYTARPERSGLRSGSDIGLGIGSDLGFGLLSLIGSLGDGLVPSNPGPRPEPAEPSGPNLFEPAAEDAHRRGQRQQEEADAERRRRDYDTARE